MSEEGIPLKPLSRADIHKLETALIIATLLREDVLQKIRESTEGLTWIDSLAVAAGALARARAGMTAEQIAEDLGRSEATIRRHLTGKTEAAKLVEETYRRFASEGVKIELPALVRGSDELSKKVSDLEAKLREAEERARALEEKLAKARSLAEELVKALS
jgi:probable regulatory domain-containing protein